MKDRSFALHLHDESVPPPARRRRDRGRQCLRERGSLRGAVAARRRQAEWRGKRRFPLQHRGIPDTQTRVGATVICCGAPAE